MKLYKYKKKEKKVTYSKSEGSIVESDNAGKKLNGIIGDLFGFIFNKGEAFWFISFLVSRYI